MSQSSRTLSGFILGAAAGIAVGYFLNEGRRDQLVEGVKERTDHLKHKAEALKDKIKDKAERVAEAAKS